MGIHAENKHQSVVKRYVVLIELVWAAQPLFLSGLVVYATA